MDLCKMAGFFFCFLFFAVIVCFVCLLMLGFSRFSFFFLKGSFDFELWIDIDLYSSLLTVYVLAAFCLCFFPNVFKCIWKWPQPFTLHVIKKKKKHSGLSLKVTWSLKNTLFFQKLSNDIILKMSIVWAIHSKGPPCLCCYIIEVK